MFLDIDKKNPNKIAVIDDSGTELSYGILCEYAEELNKALPYRTLVFILAENCIIVHYSYISKHIL